MVWLRMTSYIANKMKALTVFVLFGAFSAPLLAHTKCITISMNGAKGWIPVSYYENNRLTGVVPTIITNIFNEIGVEVKQQPIIPWKRLLNDLEIGKLDVLTGAYYNDERAKKYQYSNAITVDEIRIFVKKGKEFPFYDLSDLKGLIGVRPMGGSYGQGFDDYAKKNLHINENNNTLAMLKLLLQGKVDYAVWGYYDGLGNIAQHHYQDQITALPTPVSSNNVYALFSKQSPCLSQVDRFNQILERMHIDGDIDEIIEEHLIHHFP